MLLLLFAATAATNDPWLSFVVLIFCLSSSFRFFFDVESTFSGDERCFCCCFDSDSFTSLLGDERPCCSFDDNGDDNDNASLVEPSSKKSPSGTVSFSIFAGGGGDFPLA